MDGFKKQGIGGEAGRERGGKGRGRKGVREGGGPRTAVSSTTDMVVTCSLTASMDGFKKSGVGGAHP